MRSLVHHPPAISEALQSSGQRQLTAPCCAVPCCAALQWWQVDVGYYLICMLGWLGLAWDIKVPSPADKARKRKQTVVVKAD